MDNEQVRGWLARNAQEEKGTFNRVTIERLLADSEAYAKLRAEIAGAPVGTVVCCDLEHYERPAWHVVDDRYSVTLNEPKRVALLPVGGV